MISTDLQYTTLLRLHDTSAYGTFNGSINEEVITDLESEYLAEIGENYSIDVDYSANY